LKHAKAEDNDKSKIQKILPFVRKQLILAMLPIRSYASSQSRVETIDKLYELISSNSEPKEVCSKFLKKVELVSKVSSFLEKKAVKSNRLVCECLFWAFSILEKRMFD
jgi:hypothetical protein